MQLLYSLLFPLLGLAALEPRQRYSSSPCSIINDAVDEAILSESGLTILGATAVDCLRSMPYDSGLGQAFIKEFTKYIQFQSTLEALTNPPDTYKSPSVNILGGLQKISEADYDSQYDFDNAISSLLFSAHDGHLSATLCSLQPFFFQIESQGLVSVSEDGRETPSVYFIDDLAAREDGEEVSSVVQINGKNAEDFLNTFADNLDSQDPDTRWNRLFRSLAVQASDDPLSGRGRLTFNGQLWIDSDYLEFEFRNGSSLELPITAFLRMDSFNSTGEALFERLCMPVDQDDEEQSGGGGGDQESNVLPPQEQGPVGYPEPVIRDPYNQMLGFELDHDTMVMYVSTFGGPKGLPANQSAVFADTATAIVNHATATGRSQIIIDISANLGGNILRGFDLFKIFFPDEFPYSATRFRRAEAMETLAQAGAYINKSESTSYPFLYQGQVTPDQGSDFESIGDFLGDKKELGVEVSSLFANFNYSAQATEDQPIRGYGVTIDSLNKTMPFRPENILIVGDGNCVSTCTTFVNLMTNVGGVRSLVFGGRPRKEPMQIMGGVRGAQSASFELIEDFVGLASTVLNGTDKSDLPDGFIETTNQTWPTPLANFPLKLSGLNVNLRNAYQDDNSDLPLQFEYQAADCRLFYTYDNTMDPSTTWTSAKDAIWGDGGCVDGSTGGRGSKEDREKSLEDSKDDGDSEGSGQGESAASGLKTGSSLFLAFIVSLAMTTLA